MLKLMGKKIFTILRRKNCLSKPVKSQAPLNFHADVSSGARGLSFGEISSLQLQ